MGTCCSRPEVPQTASTEEKVLTYYQNILKYHQNTVEAITASITANNTNNLVTQDQLNTIGLALSLNLADIDSIDSKIFRFYRTFIAKGSSFDARRLKILGVLLGKGNLKAKLTEYFPLIPGMDDNKVSDNGVKSFLEDLVAISAVYLPVLAIEDTPAPGQSFSREQYEEYRDKLLSGKDAVIGRIMTAFLGKTRTIAKEQFVLQADEHSDIAKILGSAFLVRSELLNEAANQQKGAAFKQAYQGFSANLTAGTKK